VDLVELMAARPHPGAGLIVTVTNRCPMTCAHCSSSSDLRAGGPDPAELLRFVRSFGAAPSPGVLLLTGGEPMLRPGLVAELARAARRHGTRSAVLTGAFFARDGALPVRIREACEAVDHFSVSIDAFHEREVPRAAVFALLRRVLDLGVPVSVHAAGQGDSDPYLESLVHDVRVTFGDAVPMLVNTIRPIGRAAGCRDAAPISGDDGLNPCSMAAWPVVAKDGVVVACCNQATVDLRPVPEHLLLGHIATDGWAAVRERALTSPTLRMIRVTGPRRLWGDAAPGYCQSCRRLGERPAALAAAARVAGGAAGELLDRQAALTQLRDGPVGYLRRHACARYAGLVEGASR
jgi:pyruvate-formate lyase-activating enzyme